jgi:hypothetical protein
MRRSKDDPVVAAQPIGSAAGGSSVESTRPGVKRSLQRLYAAEAAQSTNRKAAPVTTTPANERRQSGASGEPTNENRESGASPANESSAASLLSQKMREELRERARKINSLVFNKACSTSTIVQPSSSPGPSTSLDVSSNIPALCSLSPDLSSSHHTPSTSSCQHTSAGEKEKKKKKKRKKDKKFEGTRVPHLTKVRPYRPPAELPSPEEEEDSKQERKKTTDAAAAAAQDDYVLAKLFAKSGGVHSALRHDTIMDDAAADHALLEAEAAQAAKAAVRALRDSRRAYAAAPTSSAGGSSRFGKKKKKTSLGNGATNQLMMTSADLLARIRARNKVVVTAAAAVVGPEREEEGEEESLFFPTAAATAAAGGGGGEEGGLGAQQSELLTDIRNFIAFQVRKKVSKVQCCGTGTATFCLCGTGTGMHSGSGSRSHNTNRMTRKIPENDSIKVSM